jgi:hypothetical protein
MVVFPTFIIPTLQYSYGSKFLKFKIPNGSKFLKFDIPKGSKFLKFDIPNGSKFLMV